MAEASHRHALPRATAEAVRAVYPACLSGIITEEEAVEITTPPAHNGNGSHPLPAPEPIP
jgi:hypothetical protein